MSTGGGAWTVSSHESLCPGFDPKAEWRFTLRVVLHLSRHRKSRIQRLFDQARAFIQVDRDLTLRVMTPSNRFAERILCAPALLALWLLDGLEQATFDLIHLARAILRRADPDRPSSHPD